MKISLIIPFHNEDKYIQRHCESIANQDFDINRVQIIYVNNLSCDRSESIIRSYPLFHLVRSEKLGAYHARNVGISSYPADLYIFADADYIYPSNWLTTVVNQFKNADTHAAIGYVNFDDSSSLILKLFNRYKKHMFTYCNHRLRAEYTWSHGGNMAFRNTCLEQIGYFTESSGGEDTNYIQKIKHLFGSLSVSVPEDMTGTHLEVSSVRDFLTRSYRRGVRKSWRNDRIKHMPLTEQLNCYAALIKSKEGLKTLAAILPLLLTEKIFFLAGRLNSFLNLGGK